MKSHLFSRKNIIFIFIFLLFIASMFLILKASGAGAPLNKEQHEESQELFKLDKFGGVTLDTLRGGSPGIFFQQSSSKKELTVDNAESLFRTLDCSDIDIFLGNPSYWDSAIGANCILDDGSPIVIRIFAQDSARKVLSDWDEVIVGENQLIYSESWFATGKKEHLKKIFSQYKYIEISNRTPEPEELSEKEFDISMCSSTTYFLVEKLALDSLSEMELNQYLEHYPNIEKVISKIDSQMESDEFGMSVRDNFEYEILEYSSKFDKEIKESCSS